MTCWVLSSKSFLTKIRSLWLHADDYGDPTHVAWLVHKFLKRFRPDQCWSLTYANTCSKPKLANSVVVQCLSRPARSSADRRRFRPARACRLESERQATVHPSSETTMRSTMTVDQAIDIAWGIDKLRGESRPTRQEALERIEGQLATCGFNWLTGQEARRVLREACNQSIKGRDHVRTLVAQRSHRAIPFGR